MANYEEVFKLPSKALLYGESGIPEQIKLKVIGTGEEKILFGSNSGNTIDKILRSCITEPTSINIGDLLPADKHFLLMKLRIISYGSDYHVRAFCSECGEEQEFKVNLDDIVIHELPDDFTEPLERQLPSCQDDVELRVLRDKDFANVREQAKKRAKRSGAKVGEVEYILKLARYIKSVNGKDLTPPEAEEYVKGLVGRDSAYIKHVMSSIKLGYDGVVEGVCSCCGSVEEVPLQMTGEFFRPRFDD